MSSLAKYLRSVGFAISGSDICPNRFTEELSSLGAEIRIGHSAGNLADAQVVVYNSAIPEENPELKTARENKLFVLSRGQLLAMVAENFGKVVGVSGCHGKTTTVCFLAHMLKAAREKFTAHIGGEDRRLSNCVADGSRIFVSEVCEFRKNIDLFSADVAVCLNVDADHMDCYKDIDELAATYRRFLEKAETKIVCGDDPRLAEWSGEGKITVGFGEDDDYRATDLRCQGGK